MTHIFFMVLGSKNGWFLGGVGFHRNSTRISCSQNRILGDCCSFSGGSWELLGGVEKEEVNDEEYLAEYLTTRIIIQYGR